MAIWTVTDFQNERNLGDFSTTLLTPALNRAETKVKLYITDEAYADAILESPVDEDAALLIRECIGDLATFYLQQRGILPPIATAASKSYSGIKSYKVDFKHETISEEWNEDSILAQLLDYRRGLGEEGAALEMAVAWGTGRFYSDNLVEVEDEDAD